MPFLRLAPARRWWPENNLPITVGLLWLVMVAVLVWMKPAAGPKTLCLFRNLTGVPCPTCGSTRAALAAAGGRPLEALGHNPFVVVAAGLGAAWLLLRTAFGRAVILDLEARSRRAAWAAVVVLFAVNWGYVIVRA